MQLRRELGRLVRRTPWYLWPFIPASLLAVGMWLAYAAASALLSVAYSWLYPDRSAHVYDLFESVGSAGQRAQLARWRSAYGRLSFVGRVRRMFKPGGQRWRAA